MDEKNLLRIYFDIFNKFLNKIKKIICCNYINSLYGNTKNGDEYVVLIKNDNNILKKKLRSLVFKHKLLFLEMYSKFFIEYRNIEFKKFLEKYDIMDDRDQIYYDGKRHLISNILKNPNKHYILINFYRDLLTSIFVFIKEIEPDNPIIIYYNFDYFYHKIFPTQSEINHMIVYIKLILNDDKELRIKNFIIDD